MERLDEHDVALSFIGKSVDMEKFSRVFDEDYDNKYILNCVYFEDDELCDKFRITYVLYEKWMYKGIDFRVYVTLKDGRIEDCSIFKYEDPSGGSCGRPQGGEVSPNQQEIRIFRRIMDYVVQGEK